MKKSGPIIVIEDDPEDQQILEEIFKNLKFPNKIIFFSDGPSALDYLTSTREQPFLILSDINMPVMDGFEVRDKVFKNEKLKSIPYLFFTTGVDKKAVCDAYELSVQGFFLKPASMTQLEDTIKKIIDYWQVCYSPSQFN